MFPPEGTRVQTGDHPFPTEGATKALLQEMSRFSTLASMERSSFWRDHSAEVELLCHQVQRGGPGAKAPVQDDARHLRIVHWNIERGKKLPVIQHNFQQQRDLQGADLILLNEVDVGMARSGNRHTARELANNLGMHWIFSPAYIELTKGMREEIQAPGENKDSLHGLAVLSKEEPILVERIELPEIFDTFDFVEKRYGSRIGLLVHFGRAWQDLVVAIVHLEVRDTPAGRRRQMQALLKAIDQSLKKNGREKSPVLLAGDLNTHTFPRGSFKHKANAVRRILGTPLDRLAEEMTEPWRDNREPLFSAMTDAGYHYEDLNDRSPTITVLLRGVEEAEMLPALFRRWIGRAAALGERVFPMRLDWFAARGFGLNGDKHQPFRVTRAATVVPSAWRGDIPSDHFPLLLELEISGT
ncbi:MAG: endonuclease/exonuclease/phosphatase family protein [Candidatus Eisenbacteria bacterium]|uniref:Endonuclease/exonuclease/phosphatase family protein n=1 Tax=Eiseniibacteriota bacterium TaxID=2212470 RepID=A0A948RYT8_UNCEI|nr:endonuclease/exonuclease/phosphatase family protein [Candidatus Eisenbacteria bacterium]MBU1949599.1 endonuclease/exonuclease/phosphatase family protein [Candidatus Eisenbacteria bacterium]MBU2690739.1 endonuclease/exonuclease/phosphatase family protein [Candidatus Eisenbacteria bacterium]